MTESKSTFKSTSLSGISWILKPDLVEQKMPKKSLLKTREQAVELFKQHGIKNPTFILEKRQ